MSKSKVYSEEFLKELGLVDSSERLITSKDYIDVICCKCNCIYNRNFFDIKRLYPKKWQCKSCSVKHANISSKTTRYPESYLQKLGLVNITERVIFRAELVEVKCGECEYVKKQQFVLIKNQTNAEERGWRCKKCKGQELDYFARGVKSKKTCLSKYGVEFFFQSKKYDDLYKQNQWFTSKPELEIFEYISSFGLEVHKTKISHSEIDIFIPSLNVGIEYNGLYWHCEKFKKAKYHLNKTILAQKHGIKLFHIFEHEWRDKKDQVKSRLKSLLNKNEFKIGARKCEIVHVDKQQAFDFIDKTHIQGHTRNIIDAIGLKYNNEIIALATFGYHHRDTLKFTLNRFACKDGYTISGALSKISKYASNHYKKDIISWCDLRWSDGNGYIQSGWNKEEVLGPDYFYTNKQRVFSKQSRKKSIVKTPEGMTEHEHALADGLFRIYDCGKIRFIYKYQAK